MAFDPGSVFVRRNYSAGTSIKAKTTLILAVIMLCSYAIIGFPKSKAELMANLKNNIRLSLDLDGGTQLVVEVQVQDAIKAYTSDTIAGVEDELWKAGILCRSIERHDPQAVSEADHVAVEIKGIQSAKARAFARAVQSRFNEWNFTPLSATDFRLTMKPASALKLRHATVAQTVAIFERKLNGFGLAGSSVLPVETGGGNAELVVELPGVDDAFHAKQILQTQAMVEVTGVIRGPIASPGEAFLDRRATSILGTRWVPTAWHDGQQSWYLVSRTPLICTNDIRDAHATLGDGGRWETEFVITEEAERRLQRYVQVNAGNRLATVVNGNVVGVPAVQTQIGNTQAIAGTATRAEALDLALNLSTGSLPVRICYLKEKTIGWSRGMDSLHSAVRAGFVSLLLIVFFLLFYYKHAGINAALVVVLNPILVIGVIRYLGIRLTLLGLAGIILTMGIAGGSTVLIFERIREELRAGKAEVAALRFGFRKSFLAVLDTHVTTALSCSVFLVLGNGPVKDFSVDLMVGLISSLFTSVFVLRTMLDLQLSRLRRRTI